MTSRSIEEGDISEVLVGLQAMIRGDHLWSFL